MKLLSPSSNVGDDMSLLVQLPQFRVHGQARLRNKRELINPQAIKPGRETDFLVSETAVFRSNHSFKNREKYF